jgi:DNA-binding NarL/FixJ family response regulator
MKPPPLNCLRCALLEMRGSMTIPRYANHEVQTQQRQERIKALKPKILELMAEGKRTKQILEEIDMPRSTVYTYIREMREMA